MSRRVDPLTSCCTWASWVLPLGVGLWSLGGWPAWRDDLAIVRDLGLVPVGSEGVVSTVLAQLFALLPVGGRLLRASMVSVVALALCSRLAYGMLGRLLDRQGVSPLSPVVALLGSLLWVFSPAAQLHGAGVGGAAVALSLLMVGVALAEPARARADARVVPLASGLVGLTLVESHSAGLMLAAVLLVSWATGRVRPGRWPVVAAGLSLSVMPVAAALHRFLRPLSANAWVDLGVATPRSSWQPTDDVLPDLDAIALVPRMLERWVEHSGWVVVGLALLGVVGALSRLRRRRAVVGWLSLLSVCAVVELLRLAGWVRPPPLLPVATALALVGFAALALQALARGLWTAPLPFARPASILTLSFAATLVLARAEQLPADRDAGPMGAEVWAEEALGKLPPGSLALVRSEPLAYRLMSARVLSGTRPDVVVVPAALLSRGSVARHLLELEPELSPLLRQLAVNGFPDEYSLCRLSDARPLFVELDPNWDLRLLEHLRPESMWLGFSPHALGSSDRRAGFERSRSALRRVLAASARGGSVDEHTREVLSGQAGQQALTLAALGDRDNAATVLRVMRRLEPDSSLAAELSDRLAHRRRGRIEVGDLID